MDGKKKIEVVAAVIEKDGKIFCCQRPNKGEAALKWEFPGGKIEAGESKEEALLREIKEELNSNIRINEFIATINYEYNTFSLIMHVYKCSLLGGKLEISEHISSLWLEKEDLYKLDWAPADRLLIEKSLNKANITDYLIKIIDFSKIEMSEEYFYNSIVLCIIDSIYSINSNYTSTSNVVKRYCEKFGIMRFKDNNEVSINIENEHTVNDFLNNILGFSYDYLAENIFNNRQRTSAVNGILKAQAVVEFAKILERYDINSFKDIDKIYDNKVKKELLKIRGQSSGLSYTYFLMLLGDENLIKKDRHIIDFIYNVTQKRVSEEEVNNIFDEIIDDLKKQNIDMTRTKLDNIIWNFMRNKAKNRNLRHY